MNFSHTYKSISNVLLVATLFATIVFYFWLNWSSELPILDGDHAYLLLMTDWLSPFADSNSGFSPPPVIWNYSPPLYPLLLGLAGGSSSHIQIAHAITITFLMLALMSYVLWARHETNSSTLSLALAVVFALLPVTFFQSFGILTENLYLLLSLLAIGLAAKTDISLTRLYIVAFVVALAALTRMVGITLILAFAIHVFLCRRDQWIRLSLISAAPLLLWSALKRSSDDQTGYIWILSNILETKSLANFLSSQLLAQAQGLWAGWIISFDHDPSLNTMIVGSVIGALCLAGSFYRAYLKKFDAIYLLLYFALLLIWPFTQAADTSRFLFVAFPILLLHGLKLVQLITPRFSQLIAVMGVSVYFIAIMLIAVPAEGLIYQRLKMGAESENKQYLKSIYWYSGKNTEQNIAHNRIKINTYKLFTSSWHKLDETVPKDECVYSVDPTWLMLYAQRRSYYPPLASTKDQFLHQAGACRYFYVASYTRGPYELFYPRHFLTEGQIVVINRIEEPNRYVIGMLIKLSKK